MDKNNYKQLVTAIAITASPAIFLTAPTTSQAEDEGFSYNVDFLIAQEDNVYLQENGEIATTVTEFSPSTQYSVRNPSNEFSLAASANLGGYAEDSNDNYMDLVLGGKGVAYTSKKTTVFGSAKYLLGHDRRGAGRTDTALQSSPDTYNENRLAAGFGYGADETGAPRAEVEIGQNTRDYSNNTATTSLSDVTQTTGKATLFYKLQPSTTLLIEASSTQFDYRVATLDSTQNRVMAGVTWEITGQTSGSLKAGSTTKTFDDSTIADGATSSWELSANWSPLSYSIVTISSTRNFDETRGTGDYTEATGAALGWDHGWNNQLSTNLSLISSEIDYINNPRKDKLTSSSLNVSYKFNESIILKAGYSNSKRDSNEVGASYTNNRISAQISLTI